MHRYVVHELLTDACYQHESRKIISGNTLYTYGTIYKRVIRLADRLTRLGITPKTVVGVMDVNSHRYFELKYALSMVGAVIHTINFRLSPTDILFTIRDAQDEWVFLWEGFGPLAANLAVSLPRHVWMGNTAHDKEAPDYETLIAEGRERVPDISGKISPTDAYSIFYTTGTTGKPKGLRYTHQQMLMGALQIAHHLALFDTGAKISTQDVIMPLIPFFHIHGWGIPFIAPYLGASLVLPESGGPAEQIRWIREHHVTWSNMVPTQLFMLIEEAKKQKTDRLILKILTGGSPLSLGLAKQADRLGISYSLIYGGSDQLGSAITTATQPQDSGRLERLRSRLTPFPLARIETRADSLEPLPPDGHSLGELWVQSPWLPEGYLNDPGKTQMAFDGGWFRSGDLAVRYPDGTFSVADRMKDAIKSGGEWILGSTIESVLSEIPGVRAAAVIALADDKWGERPMAVVETQGELTPAILYQALNQAVQEGRLAKFWIPDTIRFIDSMPMTSAGKIDKKALREGI